MPAKPGVPPPTVRYAPITDIAIYFVTEDELEALAQGSPGSQLLSISYALLPVSASFVVALLTTDIPSRRLFDVFAIVAVVAGALGAVCLAVGWKNYRSNKTLVARIRGRMPPADSAPI